MWNCSQIWNVQDKICFLLLPPERANRFFCRLLWTKTADETQSCESEGCVSNELLSLSQTVLAGTEIMHDRSILLKTAQMHFFSLGLNNPWLFNLWLNCTKATLLSYEVLPHLKANNLFSVTNIVMGLLYQQIAKNTQFASFSLTAFKLYCQLVNESIICSLTSCEVLSKLHFTKIIPSTNRFQVNYSTFISLHEYPKKCSGFGQKMLHVKINLPSTMLSRLFSCEFPLV